MPVTISNTTGDGVTSNYYDTDIELPDSGTSVMIGGSVGKSGGSRVAITGSPLTMPAAPGSGSVYWNIQVDTTTGAATVQQSVSADPAPINANNVVVFRQTLVPASTDPALTAESTPDTV